MSVKTKLTRLEERLGTVDSGPFAYRTPGPECYSIEETGDLLRAYHILNTDRERTIEEEAFIEQVLKMVEDKRVAWPGPLKLH
jgi:hypothetical protein